MSTFDLSLRPPERVAAPSLIVPGRCDLAFEGFGREAFAILERLRQHPHVGQYRQEKDGIQAHLKEPFKAFRDDLAVNWVLPNRLAFETEKNVFSRLLKNDFGAGGCYHHLWMSFYRPGRRRLTDFQLTQSIHPDAFRTGLFVGGYARDLLGQARSRILQDPDRFLSLLNPLLGDDGWSFCYERKTGADRGNTCVDAPLRGLPDELGRADAIWIRKAFDRDQVVAWGPALVRHAIDAVVAVWPLYVLWAS